MDEFWMEVNVITEAMILQALKGKTKLITQATFKRLRLVILEGAKHSNQINYYKAQFTLSLSWKWRMLILKYFHLLIFCLTMVVHSSKVFDWTPIKKFQERHFISSMIL